jgi:cell division protein YceG involved in septum cleavage
MRSPATTPIASPGCRRGRSPIPGRDSIAAVLDPAPTKALYFVADGTGGHVFADTLAEHKPMSPNGMRSAAPARCS